MVIVEPVVFHHTDGYLRGGRREGGREGGRAYLDEGCRDDLCL